MTEKEVDSGGRREVEVEVEEVVGEACAPCWSK